MNKYLLVAVSSTLLSFSALSHAATEITRSDADNYTKIGVVSVDVHDGTLDAVVKMINKEADEKNADAYRISSLGDAGMGDTMRGTAEIYKKK
ncbi:DUF1471 domain-containing protein [Hafnia alvei]|uniref:YdgH/BhsA/McbA-like domain-containing protein n=1 Tax=Hafnia alvei TaxID=569 RepID=A0A1C6YW52_HAFAL|nr:DUF1471 domain-containing protein [Hafnia alvei]NLS56210.1 DUF1471 domain-containing protein [Hafnia alvei]SCM51005.1 Protein of unknown function (DUF1471) [Hafnia alvei]